MCGFPYDFVLSRFSANGMRYVHLKEFKNSLLGIWEDLNPVFYICALIRDYYLKYYGSYM